MGVITGETPIMEVLERMMPVGDSLCCQQWFAYPLMLWHYHYYYTRLLHYCYIIPVFQDNLGKLVSER